MPTIEALGSIETLGGALVAIHVQVFACNLNGLLVPELRSRRCFHILDPLGPKAPCQEALNVALAWALLYP